MTREEINCAIDRCKIEAQRYRDGCCTSELLCERTGYTQESADFEADLAYYEGLLKEQ